MYRRSAVLGLLGLLAGCACSNEKTSQVAAEQMRGQRFGLGRNELYLDEHVVWNEERVHKLRFELNAGQDCKGEGCLVVLEATTQRGGEFKKVGELSDDGKSADRTANDGMYSASVDFFASTLKDRLYRFRARIDKTHSISNIVYLSVSPKRTPADTAAFRDSALPLVERFRALDATKRLELQQLASEAKSISGISDAAVSKDGNAMILVSDKRELGLIERESAPQTKGVPRVMRDLLMRSFSRSSCAADGSQPTPASKLKCGGWEGNATVLAPYYFQFGSGDDGVQLGEKLDSDPKHRFKVDIVKAGSKGGGSVGWFTDIFEARNALIISTHGGRFAFEERDIAPDLDSYFYQESLPDGSGGEKREIVLYVMDTNAPAPVGPPARAHHTLQNSMLVSIQNNTTFLTPSFFSQQRGMMKTQAFAYLGFCLSGANMQGFVSAFAQRGARVVFNYDNTYQVGSWASGNAERVAKQVLEGGPLSKVDLQNPDSFPNGGGFTTVNFHASQFVSQDDPGDVQFGASKDDKAAALTMKLGEDSVSLKPAGCFHHDTPLGVGKVWTCRWTRNGEPDTSPALNINFMANKKPPVGTLNGFDATVTYGDRECTQFDSLAYPERVRVKLLKWKSDGMSVRFEGVLSNNGPLTLGEGGFEMKTIKDGVATNFILD